jgi:hypothetical protein
MAAMKKKHFELAYFSAILITYYKSSGAECSPKEFYSSSSYGGCEVCSGPPEFSTTVVARCIFIGLLAMMLSRYTLPATWLKHS